GNLSDFVELQAGRLVLERADAAPAAILRKASELIAPIARERGGGFASQVAEPPAIACDAERGRQMLASPATAAVKAPARARVPGYGGGRAGTNHAPPVAVGRRGDRGRRVVAALPRRGPVPSGADEDPVAVLPGRRLGLARVRRRCAAAALGARPRRPARRLA